jgi:hypothetical protein
MTRRPPQRPQEPPPGGYRLPTPAEVCRALLRHLPGRAALSTAAALRRLADRIDRAAPTTRNRAVGLSVVPGGYAQGRADLALTHQVACCPHSPGGPHSLLCQRKDTP